MSDATALAVRPEPVSPADLAARRDERRLARGLRTRDPAALTEIHRRHGPAVLAYLRGTLADAGAAEDVHQDVFLEVWRRGPGFDPRRSPLGAWIMLIARSRAIDHMRRRLPEPRGVPGEPGGLPDTEDPARPTDEVIERWRVAALLAELDADEARLLRMRFSDGLSQSEIAERLGIPLGTVKTRMVRALGRLRTLIDEAGA